MGNRAVITKIIVYRADCKICGLRSYFFDLWGGTGGILRCINHKKEPIGQNGGEEDFVCVNGCCEGLSYKETMHNIEPLRWVFSGTLLGAVSYKEAIDLIFGS